MRRTFVVVLLLLVIAPAHVRAQERPPLRASLAACESGPQAGQRFAVFTASMPALAGTRQMSMRFDLMERRDGARRRWRRLTAPAFGRWDRSKEPGAAGFIYTKRVERLSQAAEYRATVRRVAPAELEDAVVAMAHLIKIAGEIEGIHHLLARAVRMIIDDAHDGAGSLVKWAMRPIGLQFVILDEVDPSLA
jgi:hypothetical protein